MFFSIFSLWLPTHIVNCFLHLFFNDEACACVRNPLIYADGGDIPTALLCSASEEGGMEKRCRPRAVLFVLETGCCL